MAGYFFNIDVLGFGACNLRCPTCPVGNSPDVSNPAGLMSVETLHSILSKATAECRVSGVGLYNWTEPLLHPHLDDLIDVVHQHGLSCDLSTNLNNIRHVEKALAKNPRYLRISCSGFTQQTYGTTHRGGDIETVKQNMRVLMEIHHCVQSTTQVEMHYHRYADNLDDEPLMRDYCAQLDIGFVPVLAFFMPVEKLVAHLENDPALAGVTQDDLSVMQKLIIPIDQAIAITRQHSARPCILQDEQVTLDFQGNVQLCCATYDSARFTLVNYLEVPLARIQQLKQENSFCSRCMNHGLHVYYTAGTHHLNQAAVANSADKHHAMLQDHPAWNTGTD